MLVRSEPNPAKPLDVVTIVEDDLALLNALRFSFEVDGYAVQAFPTAEALLADAELPLSGVLVIDYKLPGLDGLELLARLRERGAAAPALLITTPNDQVMRKAAAAGIRVVEKPLVATVLLEAVQGLFARRA